MFDGYIRVSQVAGRGGERFISPEVQREQIETWAAHNGVVVGEIFEELDESGARKDRPLLMEALARVEGGLSEGLIVAKLDRFGRSLVDGLSAIDRLTSAGGSFVSAQDGLDLRTDTGKLVLRLMLSMAEWELDRVRSNWDAARARANARGVHMGRTPPFGYRRDPRGRLTPDPDSASLLRHIFRMRGQGRELVRICRWLESRNARTTQGNRGWTANTIRNILRNRVYLGELHHGVYSTRGAHPALVSRAAWQSAQHPGLIEPRARVHEPTLLGGLVRCAGCGTVMNSTWVRARSRLVPTYSCSRHSSTGRCRAPTSITGPVIEPYVEAAFFGQREGLEVRRRRARGSLNAFADRVSDAEAALDSYRDNERVRRVLGDDRFADGLARRKEQLDAAMKALSQEDRRLSSWNLPASTELQKQWPGLTLPERREAIGQLFDCVFIEPGRARADERAFLCRRGELPIGLPAPSKKRRRPIPFDRRRHAYVARPRKPRLWPKHKLESELTRFLSGHQRWPNPEEFVAAGYGPAYSQVLRRGGVRVWAKQMGVQAPARVTTA